MKATLKRAGLCIDAKELESTLGPVAIDELTTTYTVRTKMRCVPRPKVITCAKQVVINVPRPSRLFVIPRFAVSHMLDSGLLLRKNITNKLPLGAPVNFVWRETAKLTPNQQLVVDHLNTHVYTPENIEIGTASAISVVRAGYGKTYIAGATIAARGRKAMYIVPSEYLLEQTVADLRSMFTNPIGVWYGTKKIDGDIIVAIHKSVSKFNDWATIGMVVYDEIHVYPTLSNSVIFRIAQAKCGLGLTATPDERLDKFDRVSGWYVGPVVRAHDLPGWNPAGVIFSTSVTKVEYSGPPEYTIQHTSMGPDGKQSTCISKMIEQLMNDRRRNEIVVITLRELAAGKNVFGFCEQRAHCELIRDMLVASGFPESDIVILYGGADDAVTLAAKQTARIILTTYAYSSFGVSIPRMDAMLMITPRRNKMRQILFRIMRLGGDTKSRREIVDLVDVRVSLKSQYSTRRTVYGELNADIRRVKIGFAAGDNEVREQLGLTARA